MKTNYIIPFFCLLAIAMITCTGCTGDKPVEPQPEPEPIKVDVPAFDFNNAYSYVQKQVDFGPRVPQTPAHTACADWLKSTFESFGWQSQFQEAEVEGFDGKPMKIKNIIASINPENKKRVLLCAHWDTRRIADQDSSRKNEPILGADDGGSGVAILLEMARAISTKKLDLGIDIVLFDAEDQGESGSATRTYRKETWCIGSQYWSRHPHTMAQKPYMGILLDMVGSKGARFPKEGLSTRHAGGIVNQVWGEALVLGFSDLFVNGDFKEIVDDHLFVNDIAKIPTIDIINLPTNPASNGTFGHYWHTHKDNMAIIERHTLRAVGEVLLSVLYKNGAGVL